MTDISWNKRVLKMPHLGLKKALKSTSFGGLRHPGPPVGIGLVAIRSLATQSPNIQVGTSTSINFCFGTFNILVEKAWVKGTTATVEVIFGRAQSCMTPFLKLHMNIFLEESTICRGFIHTS